MRRIELAAMLVVALAALSADARLLAQNVGGFAHELDEAEKKLAADIKACRPIDESEYRRLMDQSSANFYTAEHAAKSGLPVDFKQIADDGERATRLFERAHFAASKPCPPPNQAQATGKPPANPPPPPPPPPQPASTPQAAGGQHPPPPPPPPPPRDSFKQLEDDAEDALDELDEAMDRCDEAWVKSLIPDLEDLSKEAHAAADAARAAGQFSLVKASEAAAMARDLDEAIADAKKFKCPVKPFRSYRVLPISLSPMDERIVYIHNFERDAVHAPALKWNFKLEWDATGYANELERTHQLIHAPREGRGIERENLLQANIGWSADRMMQSWTMEKRDFAPGYFPNVARDGDWMNVAHYTQMIWPTTTYIGCGYAEGGGYGWLVCRYSPGGNKDGKPVGLYNPGPERG